MSEILLAAAGALGFGWYLVAGGRLTLRPANLVTAARAAAAVAALLISGRAHVLGGALPASAQWLITALLICAEITDVVDGQIARRTGPTAFGARLDMETDAYLMLALSLLAYRWWGLPPWVLFAGAARYLFYLLFLFTAEPVFPTRFRWFAKSVAAASAVLLLVTIAPPMAYAVRLLAAALAVLLLTASFGWELGIRMRAARRPGGARPLLGGPGSVGLIRSLAIYYGVPCRALSMRRLYGQFVRQGDLVFDVGAHVGNRIRAFRSLGARVVAIEPQPLLCEYLRRHYGGDADVVLENLACGRERAVAELAVPRTNLTLGTLSAKWAADITRVYADRTISWEDRIVVNVTTLDAMIAAHGVPAFVKIDVEGHDHEVLAGLSHPVPALSFEYLPASRESAFACLDELRRLGTYRFTYSRVETMHLCAAELLDEQEMRGLLESMDERARSGDVYAILSPPEDVARARRSDA